MLVLATERTLCAQEIQLLLCFSPGSLRRWNTSLRILKCSAKFLPSTITSSKYTRQLIYCNPVRTMSINRWNVAGALQRPKGITLNSKRPSSIRNATFSWSSEFISTCQQPLIRSKVLNSLEPARVSRVSSILGRGWASFLLRLLNVNRLQFQNKS